MSDNKKLFFGLKRSKIDLAERKLSMPQCDKIDLPSCFSLKEKVKQVFDQSGLNACSANAAANFLSLSDKVDYNISRCSYTSVQDSLIIIICYQLRITGQL